jgi:hypothetical protein
MPAPIPLGVNLEDGSPLQVISDEDALLKWSNARAGIPVAERSSEADCVRPEPSTPLPVKGAHLGVVNLEGEQLDNLKRTGWAVLYGPNTSAEIKKQLKPLIDFRAAQVGNDALCKVFDDGNFPYKPGQSVDDWLGQMKVSSSNQVRVSAGVPFYIMIVASPEDISFEFQYRLDVYWGVGRLWLQTPENFGAYAQAVIDSESGKHPPVRRELRMFAPRFGKDAATNMTCDHLVQPLVDLKMGDDYNFEVNVMAGADASRDELMKLYTLPKDRPAIYFPISHGVACVPGSNVQKTTMGAIMAQTWDGVSAPSVNNYLAAQHLLDQKPDLTGTFHVFCLCFGVGWPAVSSYDRTPVAPTPMMAPLPQAILARGGLAVLGHVDRAWSYSYLSGDGSIDRTQEYENIFNRLMKGARAGHVTDAFNARWSVLAGDIAQKQRTPALYSGEEMHDLWVEHDDARDYILHGDPAVKLNLPED